MTSDFPAASIPDFTDYESWWGEVPFEDGKGFSCESVGPAGHVRLVVREGALSIMSAHEIVTTSSCRVRDVTWWSLTRGPFRLVLSLGLEDGVIGARFPMSMEECLLSGMTSTFGSDLRNAA